MNGKKDLRSLKKVLNNYQRVGVDTNIFIYYFDRRSSFYSNAHQFISHIASKELQIITSILTLIELLSFKAPEEFIDKLEQELLFIPNLTMDEVTRNIAKEAADIRRKYGFRLADSIQLATAIKAKTDVFITNDKKLMKFPGIKILLISSLK